MPRETLSFVKKKLIFRSRQFQITGPTLGASLFFQSFWSFPFRRFRTVSGGQGCYHGLAERRQGRVTLARLLISTEKEGMQRPRHKRMSDRFGPVREGPSGQMANK